MTVKRKTFKPQSRMNLMQTNQTDSCLKSIYDSFGSVQLLTDTCSSTVEVQLPNIIVKGNVATQWLLNEARTARAEFKQAEKELSERKEKHLRKYETNSYILTAKWLLTNDPEVVKLTKQSLIKV